MIQKQPKIAAIFGCFWIEFSSLQVTFEASFFSRTLIYNFRFWDCKISLKNDHFPTIVLKATFWRKTKELLKNKTNWSIFSQLWSFCFFLNSVFAMEHESWCKVVPSLNLSLIKAEFCRHCFFCTPEACDTTFSFDDSSFWKTVWRNKEMIP